MMQHDIFDTDQRRWHLKKEVTIGHIFTTMSVVLGIIFYTSKIDNRISLAEQKVEQIQAYNKDAMARADIQFSKLELSLQRIEDKLDRKVDKK